MKVLLHICCGVCAAGASEQLQAEGHNLTGYFLNPNLFPQDEYTRRLQAAVKVAEIREYLLIVPEYKPREWQELTTPLATEPERGKRCEICFRLRLQNTYEYMLKNGFDVFTTSLTIGPQKSAEIINRIGNEIGGDKFLARDFKKNGGYQRAVASAKEYGIYRQNYCGCQYSIRTG
jgi:predicted adenine nucleotide alpha hydrolase (AANH) superfamily ATPase